MHSGDLSRLENNHMLDDWCARAINSTKKIEINEIIAELNVIRLVPPFNDVESNLIRELLVKIAGFIASMNKIEFREMVRALGVSNLKVQNLPDSLISSMKKYIDESISDFDMRDISSIGYGYALMEFDPASRPVASVIEAIKKRFKEVDSIHEHDLQMLNYLRYDYQFTLEGKNASKLEVKDYSENVSISHAEVHRLLKAKFPEADLSQEYPVTNFIKADEAFPYFNIAIEVDGPHHSKRRNTDDMRDRILHNLGWTVIRIGENPPAISVDDAIKIIEQLISEHTSEIVSTFSTSSTNSTSRSVTNTAPEIIDEKFAPKKSSTHKINTTDKESAKPEFDYNSHLSPMENEFNNVWSAHQFDEHGVSGYKTLAFSLYQILSSENNPPNIAVIMMNLMGRTQKILNDNDLFGIFCRACFSEIFVNVQQNRAALCRAIILLDKLISIDAIPKNDWICIIGASLDSFRSGKSLKLFEMLASVLEGLDRIGLLDEKGLRPLMRKIDTVKDLNIKLLSTLHHLFAPEIEPLKCVKQKTLDDIKLLKSLPYFEKNPDSLIKLLINWQCNQEALDDMKQLLSIPYFENNPDCLIKLLSNEQCKQKTLDDIKLLLSLPYFEKNPDSLIKLLSNEQFKFMINGLVLLNKNNHKIDDVVASILATGNPEQYYSNLKMQLTEMYDSIKKPSANTPAKSNTSEKDPSERSPGTSPTRPGNK